MRSWILKNYLNTITNSVHCASLLTRSNVPLCALMIWRERLSPILNKTDVF